MYPVRGKAKIVPSLLFSLFCPASSSSCASFTDRHRDRASSSLTGALVPLSPPSSSASHSPAFSDLPFFVMERGERDSEWRIKERKGLLLADQIRRSMAEMAVTSLPGTCLLCLCNTRPAAEATTAELSVSLYVYDCRKRYRKGRDGPVRREDAGVK